MLNRTDVRNRSLSRVSYAAGLLVLIGAATVLVVVVRVPAHSTTRPTAPTPPGLSAYDGTSTAGHDRPDEGHPPRTGVGQPDDVPPAATGPEPTAAQAGRAAPARGAGPGRSGTEAQDLHRSLVLSGLLGLAISLTGLVMVGSRRRMW